MKQCRGPDVIAFVLIQQDVLPHKLMAVKWLAPEGDVSFNNTATAPEGAAAVCSLSTVNCVTINTNQHCNI